MDRNFCPTRKTISMEPSSTETSNVSVWNKPIDLAVSASPQVGDKRAAHDAALGSIKEENTFQGSCDEPCTKRAHLNFSDESSGKANDLSPQSFLKKLWEIVGSNRFQSIWWGDDGNCIVIVEKLFKMELLTRRGPLRAFEIDSMKTFILQLHLHGFCKMQWDLTRSSSCDEFLADKGAVSAFSKLLFYHNPYFRRDYPHLLRRCKQSKRSTSLKKAAFSLELAVKERHLRRNPLKTWSGPASTAVSAKINPQAPSLFPQHHSHSLFGIQDAASAETAASPYHITPHITDSVLPPGLGPDSKAAGDGVGHQHCTY
ncbi:heat shock transcription factor, Y-linked-like [Cygnus olor]|uniref:heat shock transcription factor, Y-linked-like n=1 Tax=Cygnus olor TaxID=8869 RepID=UPI001ADE9B83|nr:heat shock transcription factor, Y-linked-like [Cygnus olor]XP_040406628.1 heat shock transcription factor, Y-linked-like [Cygnus olor]